MVQVNIRIWLWLQMDWGVLRRNVRPNASRLARAAVGWHQPKQAIAARSIQTLVSEQQFSTNAGFKSRLVTLVPKSTVLLVSRLQELLQHLNPAFVAKIALQTPKGIESSNACFGCHPTAARARREASWTDGAARNAPEMPFATITKCQNINCTVAVSSLPLIALGASKRDARTPDPSNVHGPITVHIRHERRWTSRGVPSALAADTSAS